MRKRAGLARALALDPRAAVPRRADRRARPDRRRGVRRADPQPCRETLGLTVFLITHDLDTLYAICDRVAVLADRRVIAVGTIPELLEIDHPWIQEYFNGPRGRAAQGRAKAEAHGRRGMAQADGNTGNHVLVGGVVLAALALLAVHRLAGARRYGATPGIRHLLQQSVGGLAKGSEVTFAGVPAGQVEEIELLPRQSRVRARARRRSTRRSRSCRAPPRRFGSASPASRRSARRRGQGRPADHRARARRRAGDPGRARRPRRDARQRAAAARADRRADRAAECGPGRREPGLDHRNPAKNTETITGALANRCNKIAATVVEARTTLREISLAADDFARLANSTSTLIEEKEPKESRWSPTSRKTLQRAETALTEVKARRRRQREAASKR